MGQARDIAALDWQQVERLDDDDLVGLIGNLYRDGKTRRQEWEAEAKLALLWAEGEQDTCFSDSLTDIVRIVNGIRIGDSESDKPRFEELFPVKINTMTGAILQKIVLTLGSQGSLYARTATSDPEDESAATAQSRLLSYLWDAGPDPIRLEIVRALWFLFCTGNSFIHPIWDPAAGGTELHSVRTSETSGEARKRIAGLIDRDPDELRALPDGTVITNPGMVRWLFPTAFDITEPAGAMNLCDCDWLIYSKPESLEFLRWKYGAEAVSAIEPDAGIDPFGPGVHGAYSGSERSGEEMVAPIHDRVLTHYFWRPVRPWCLLGAYVVMAGGKVMMKGPHPYWHGLAPSGRLPFTKIDERPSIYFRGRSTAWDLIPLQYHRNRRRSQEGGHWESSIAPKMLVEDGCTINADDLDSERRIITVPAGSLSQRKFDWLRPTPLPPQAVAMDLRLVADADDVAGVHAATSGRSEFSGQSGRHAAIRVEGDARRLKWTRDSLTTAIAEAAVQSLWLFRQFATSKRLITYVGRDLARNVVEMVGDNLLPKRYLDADTVRGPYAFNVSAELTAEWDPEVTLKRIETMTQLGWWSPQHAEDRSKVARLLGTPLPPEYDRDELHRRNARSENERLLLGFDAEASPGDDSPIHIAEHRWFQTTDDFKTAVKSNARIGEWMKRHIFAHLLQAEYVKADQERAVRKAARMAAKLIQEDEARDGLAPQPPPQAPTVAPGASPVGPGVPAGGMGVNLSPPGVAPVGAASYAVAPSGV